MEQFKNGGDHFFEEQIDMNISTNTLSMSPGEKRKQIFTNNLKLGLHSFKFLKVIGKGSFGKVRFIIVANYMLYSLVSFTLFTTLLANNS